MIANRAENMPISPTRPHPVSLAELARRAGVNRSSVTRGIQGPLRAALLPGGRVDAGHRVLERWAIGHGTDPIALLDPFARPRPAIVIDRGLLSREEQAALLGIPEAAIGDLERDVRAQVDAGHVDAEEVALHAGMLTRDIVREIH